jgi:hypothetical protein
MTELKTLQTTTITTTMAHHRKPSRARLRQLADRRANSGHTFRRLRIEQLECRRLLAADILGQVFEDLDGDGTLDLAAGEIGLATRRVFLDANNDNIWNGGERAEMTAADGTYLASGHLILVSKLRET